MSWNRLVECPVCGKDRCVELPFSRKAVYCFRMSHNGKAGRVMFSTKGNEWFPGTNSESKEVRKKISSVTQLNLPFGGEMEAEKAELEKNPYLED